MGGDPHQSGYQPQEIQMTETRLRRELRIDGLRGVIHGRRVGLRTMSVYERDRDDCLFFIHEVGDDTFVIDATARTHDANPYIALALATRLQLQILVPAGFIRPGPPMTDSSADEDLAHANGQDTINDSIDLGRHPQDVRDEINAAKHGRAAYSRFLGY